MIILHRLPFVLSKKVLTASYIGNNYDATNTTSYTFSGQSVGTASANRVVFVCVGTASGASSTMTISGVTVGGVSATVQATANQTGAFDVEISAIYAVSFPTGTTADVVVTTSSTANSCGIGIYTADLASITAAATSTDTGNPIALTLSCNAGGFMIATAKTRNDGASTNWTVTGLTEDFDLDFPTEDSQMCGAHTNFATAQTSLSITLTSGGTANITAGVAVAYNP